MEIIKIIQESPLAVEQKSAIEQKFVPFIQRIGDIEKRLSAVLVQISEGQEPTKEDTEMAKIIRKALRDTRLDAEREKKEQKEEIIARGKVYDSIFKVIETTSKMLEIKANQIEKFHEIQEKNRLDNLENERREILRSERYEAFNHTFTNVRDMNDEAWQDYIDMLEAKIKAEEERKKAEAKAEEERKQAEIKAEQERQEELKAAKLAAEKAKEAAAKAEAAAAEQRKKAELERAKAEAKAEEERKKAAAEIQRQKEIAAKLQAEKDKIEAEKKKAEDEAKARLKAGDQDKINYFVKQLQAIEYPENLKDETNIKSIAAAKEKIQQIINYFNGK